MARPSSKHIEDPTIAYATAVEYEVVWQRIEARCAAGQWFYAAREQVLADSIPTMKIAYGAAVATRVAQAIERTPVTELSPSVKRAYDAHNKRALHAELDRMLAPIKARQGGRLTIWQRIGLWFGRMPS